jgi:iron complex outermembrane recepter protein
MTYYTKDNRYYVGAYVDNAFNKTALAFSFITPFSSFLTSTLQPPRTYGVRVGAHF